MKRSILMTLALAAMPVLALAAPDFNGTWVRDNAKSDREVYPLYWLTRGVDPFSGGGGGGEFTLTVKQSAQALQVVDQLHPVRNYVLDGKPKTVTMDTGIATAQVTATLTADALVIDSTQPYGGMPGNAMSKVTETWSLSPDGKSLTITTVRDVAAAKQTAKAVFSRK